MSWQVLHGDCRDLLRGVTVVHADPYHHVEFLDLPDNSIDAIVTDPPYGIHFMNKSWDSFGGPLGRRVTNKDRDRGGAMHAGTYDFRKSSQFQTQMREVFTEALRVAKPGAHLVAFGGPRTFHRLTCAAEDAGWVIRDCLMWLFGSGFPKSHNVSCAIDKSLGHPNRGKAIPTASTYQACDVNRKNKLSSNPVGEYEPRTEAAEQWGGWGTALKPAWEPIILARKPFRGTVADNVQRWGTGALNIDATRIGTEQITINRFDDGAKPFGGGAGHEYTGRESKGRWPANLILDEESARLLDEQSGESASVQGRARAGTKGYGWGLTATGSEYDDSGGASRFFKIVKHNRICVLCQCKNANGAKKASASIRVSGENTAPQSVGTQRGEQCAPGARYAESLCASCETAIVQSLVAMQTDHDQGSSRCLDFIDEPLRTTLNGSLALFAEQWGSTDTMSNTQIQTILFGYVLHVIDENTNSGDPALPGASGPTRFLYTAKSSRTEREGGLDGNDPINVNDGRDTPIDNPYQRGETKRRNTHPTVKPLDLMRWLVRLVTPPNGTVLDPFMGSGSTLVAARIEGFNAIGIDTEAKAIEIARKRVAWAGVAAGDATKEDADEVGIPTQLGLFAPKE